MVTTADNTVVQNWNLLRLQFKRLYLSYPNFVGHFGWVFYLIFLVPSTLSCKTEGPDDMIFKVLFLFLIFSDSINDWKIKKAQ